MNTNNFLPGKLCKTSDYSIFDVHENNRPLHESSLLTASMREHGFMPSCAIHCKRNGDGRIKVVRGHHRLAIAKRLNIPVYYIIDDTEIDIYQMEGDSRSRWSASDFLVSRARSGDLECKALISYQKKNRIPLSSAASLFGGESSGSNNKLKDVKAGTFKRGDQYHGDNVIAVLNILDSFKLEFTRTSTFITAVSRCLRIPCLNYNFFLGKLKSYGSYMNRKATYQDYLDELEKVYNRSTPQKQRLAIHILADIALNQRKVTFGKEQNGKSEKVQISHDDKPPVTRQLSIKEIDLGF